MAALMYAEKQFSIVTGTCATLAKIAVMSVEIKPACKAW